jgi:hypothetical protein
LFVQIFAARPSASVAIDAIALWKQVVHEFGEELELAIKVTGTTGTSLVATPYGPAM